jgi:hypothetical protein
MKEVRKEGRKGERQEDEGSVDGWMEGGKAGR